MSASIELSEQQLKELNKFIGRLRERAVRSDYLEALGRSGVSSAETVRNEQFDVLLENTGGRGPNHPPAFFDDVIVGMILRINRQLAGLELHPKGLLLSQDTEGTLKRWLH